MNTAQKRPVITTYTRADANKLSRASPFPIQAAAVKLHAVSPSGRYMALIRDISEQSKNMGAQGVSCRHRPATTYLLTDRLPARSLAPSSNRRLGRCAYQRMFQTQAQIRH